MYDFSAAGSGTFTFDPVSKFQVITANNTIETSTARSISITVIDVSKRELDLEKRYKVNYDDPRKNKAILMDGYMEARLMANLAITAIDRLGPGHSLYEQYS